MVPFNFISYAFGLTQVRLLDFVLGTAGSLPGLIAYVYSGTLSKNLFSALNNQGEGPKWLHISLLAAGVLATILVVVVTSRIVKNVFGFSLEAEPEKGGWGQVFRFKDGLKKTLLMVKAGGQSFASKLPMLQDCMQPLFDPAWGKGTTRQHLILGAMAIAWLAIVLATIWHHEFWRDEVRALSIAIASPSLWEMPVFLKNEGHPVVWYVLLRIGYQVLGSFTVLPVVSLLVAGAAIMIFLFRSPFSLSLKFLFLFSVLPLYEYSVMARNYGISMLLMFSFAALYPYRRRYPVVLAMLLAMLANTNVHSLLIAGILTVLWLWDEAVVNRQSLSARQLGLLSLAAGLIFAAALFAVKTILPNERTIATNALHAKTFIDYLNPFIMVLRRPWAPWQQLIPFPDEWLDSWPWRLLQILLTGMLLLGLTAQTRLALGLLAAFLGFGYLFNFAYPGSLRHQGILFIFMLVLYWLNAGSGLASRDALPEQSHLLTTRFYSLALLVVLPLVLLWNDYLAFYNIQKDFKNALSSTKPLGEWLNTHSEYKNSIILGEPAQWLEALPYYVTQKIYIPRESRFKNWIKITTESKLIMNLGELLNVAQGLKEREHQTILIALGVPASKFEQESSFRYSYSKMILTWTPLEWEQFKQSTKWVAAFRGSSTGEDFDIYEVQ